MVPVPDATFMLAKETVPWLLASPKGNVLEPLVVVVVSDNLPLIQEVAGELLLAVMVVTEVLEYDKRLLLAMVSIPSVSVEAVAPATTIFALLVMLPPAAVVLLAEERNVRPRKVRVLPIMVLGLDAQ